MNIYIYIYKFKLDVHITTNDYKLNVNVFFVLWCNPNEINIIFWGFEIKVWNKKNNEQKSIRRYLHEFKIKILLFF